VSDCFQARRSGIIYKRYGIVLCLLFSSLSVSAAALETGDGSGIALIDSAWHTLIEFQRQVNAGVAIHMRALETGDSFAAFFLGLGVAFLYGMIHALGPGHGKFVIMSYFMGREVYVLRGLVMAAQMAVVHVIAAVVIVWVADILLKTSLGIGLADVPGIRAGSFLIIAGIGIYMLYQAVRGSGGHTHTHNHTHDHNHHHHGHSHDHPHGASHATEGGLVALAVGMVPCPGAVLVMLYAIANDMIYPGFLLVAAMSVGIGLTIAILGVAAILLRQFTTRFIENSSGGVAVARFRILSNTIGALLVTAVGTVSFFAFLGMS
jgi:ABC-type nickel/cobalt efflux system permease component RcnA